ncbi:MAG: hypothetical protein WEB63_10475 [Cucumibacter sp.]
MIVRDVYPKGLHARLRGTSDGIEELIPTREFGQIVDPDDNAAIDAAAVETPQETEADAEARRARSRAFAETTLSTEAGMRRHVEVWQQALRGPAQ